MKIKKSPFRDFDFFYLWSKSEDFGQNFRLIPKFALGRNFDLKKIFANYVEWRVKVNAVLY